MSIRRMSGCFRRFGPVGPVFLALCLGAAWGNTQEGADMQVLKVTLDGKPVQMAPEARRENGRVLVPLHAFAQAVGAEAKKLDGDGPLAVCREDLCIPLNEQQTVEVEGTLYASLDAFGEPLGLKWAVEKDALAVGTTGRAAEAGLGIGDLPPRFTLPDLYTGEPVSSSDYLGKKTVFYVWASW